MRLHAVLAVAMTWLVATNSYSQAQPPRSAQNEQTDREVAKRQLSQVLEHDPNNKEALFALGRLMADGGDFASAGALFGRYVVISPAEPGAWAYLIRCAVGVDDPKSAADAQRQIETLAPANLALHAQAACWLAGSTFREVTDKEFELVMSLAPSQGKGGSLWFSRLGQCYESAKDSSRAARAFQAAINLDPDTEGHYFQLAHLYAREGLAGPASETMTRAVAHFPHSVQARLEAGSIELEAGNPERALEILSQAARLDPQSPGVLSLLGRIQLAQRRYPEAVATLEQATKLAPTDAGIHFYAGQSWMKTEQGTERALEHFKRSLELDASRASTYYWLGSLYFYRKHDYRIASQYLEQAVERSPDMEAAHQMLIQAYKRLGADEKASDQLRRYQKMVEQRAKAEAPK
jgi:tetratricopeptide (TPR) repeat protein